MVETVIHRLNMALNGPEKGHLAVSFPRPSRPYDASKRTLNRARPNTRHSHQDVCACPLGDETMPLGPLHRQPGKAFAVLEAMEDRRKENGETAKAGPC